MKNAEEHFEKPDFVHTRKIALARHLVSKEIRSWFDDGGFLEVLTPIVIKANCVEANIEPIEVCVNTPNEVGKKRFLHTSPEIALKKMLSYGLEKIYQLMPVFRDGEGGPIHLTEFLLLEWYRLNGDIKHLIADFEAILWQSAECLRSKGLLGESDNSKFDPFAPIQTLSMEEAWNRYAQIDLRQALVKIAAGDHDALVYTLKKAGHNLRDEANFEDAFTHIMLKCIEPNIGQKQACALVSWPIQLASLAEKRIDDPLFAARFEIYAGGIELANGFNELVDPREQELRFLKENQLRSHMGKRALPLDREFFLALERIPKAAGVALGFDRLMMLLLGETTIRRASILAQ